MRMISIDDYYYYYCYICSAVHVKTIFVITIFPERFNLKTSNLLCGLLKSSNQHTKHDANRSVRFRARSTQMKTITRGRYFAVYNFRRRRVMWCSHQFILIKTTSVNLYDTKIYRPLSFSLNHKVYYMQFLKLHIL